MYAFVFTLMSAALAYLAIMHGGAAVVLWWAAMSFLLVAVAYAGAGPRLLGKRHDGRIAWWAYVLLLPYLLFTWAIWHTARLVRREACCHQVAPRLWLGRRPLPGELPDGVRLVIDLTAEFPEHRRIVASADYLCIPTLDTTAPPQPDIAAAVERYGQCEGNVYVHCASGHGRSAVIAAVMLLCLGLAGDTTDAANRLKSIRSGVHLSPAQRKMIAEFERRMSTEST